jgi:hypothetical protein
MHAFATVGEAQPKPIAFERTKALHVDHRQVTRRHRDQEPSQAAYEIVRAANSLPIRLVAPASTREQAGSRAAAAHLP